MECKILPLFADLKARVRGSILFPVLVRVPFKKYALILLPHSAQRQSSHICTPCRACLLFSSRSIEWAGHDHPLGARSFSALTSEVAWWTGSTWQFPTVPSCNLHLHRVHKSYRADVFTIRCCSFLFLNLFRAEEEECDLLTSAGKPGTW